MYAPRSGGRNPRDRNVDRVACSTRATRSAHTQAASVRLVNAANAANGRIGEYGKNQTWIQVAHAASAASANVGTNE